MSWRPGKTAPEILLQTALLPRLADKERGGVT